jgi:hypothetical protein
VSSLKSKVETAFVAVLQDAGLTPVVPGYSSAALDLPAIVCEARSMVETPLGTGNHTVRVHIAVRSPADPAEGETAADTEDAHATRLAAVTAALHVDDLAAQLMHAVDDFHVFGIHNRGSEAGFDGRAYSETLLFDLACCGTDL